MLIEIAHETLGIEILESRGNANVDTHTCGVDDILRALEAAYDAGLLTARRVEGCLTIAEPTPCGFVSRSSDSATATAAIHVR
jgi:hypothetical protein